MDASLDLVCIVCSCGDCTVGHQVRWCIVPIVVTHRLLGLRRCIESTLCQIQTWGRDKPRGSTHHNDRLAGRGLPGRLSKFLHWSAIVLRELHGRDFFLLEAAWLNEVRCPGGRPSVS